MTFSPINTQFFFLPLLAHLPAVRRVLFEQWGCGPTSQPTFDRVHHAIEMQAALAPQATAAVWAGQRISYEQLNRQANRLAVRLTELGVKRGDTVALFVALNPNGGRAFSRVEGGRCVRAAGRQNRAEPAVGDGPRRIDQPGGADAVAPG